MDRALKFSDVALVPRKSIVNSRTKCDTSVTFGKYKFKFGVFPSNMKSVVDLGTCEFLAKNGLFYIMHRFGYTISEVTNYMHDRNLFASVSIGVDLDSWDQLQSFSGDDPEYITIDVANAYSEKCERTIKYVKKYFPKSFLIVGNCASSDAVMEIDSWGADAIKVGIATGSVCTTYNATGFGVPQFTALLDTTYCTMKPIISDGGIKEIGDISKAFVAGASMVMAGNLFAGYDQSAGELLTQVGGNQVKHYFGSASIYNGNDKYVEGESIYIPYRGDMNILIKRIHDGLQSAISYAGGNNMYAFRSVKWNKT